MTQPNCVLITGVSGFLGQAVALAAARRGWSVVGTSRRALEEPLRGMHWIPTNYSVEHLREIITRHRPGFIVHFAGNANVRVSVEQPLFDFESGPNLLARVLDAVRRDGSTIRVLFSSSAAVYGNPASLPVSEDASCAPISAYGHHKRMCELLLQEYHAIYGVPTLAARIFSAYGAGLRKQLLWELCQRCRRGGPIELFGTGEETRDFLHADDVAEALLLLCEQGRFDGSAINVASGAETSVAEIASHVLAAWGDPKLHVAFNGRTRSGDPQRWRADVSRLRKLGFAPRSALAQGISDYVAWFGAHAESL